VNLLRELLLIEQDDLIISRFITGLQLDHVHVEWVKNSLEGMTRIKVLPWDLLIVGADMPEMSGEELLVNLRDYKVPFPIMLLTNQKNTHRTIRLFRLGANDVCHKSGSYDELIARTWNLLGLCRSVKQHEEHEKMPVRVDDIRMDPLTKTVTVEGKLVSLTQTEFDLLLYLVKHEGKVLPREQILSDVWGYDFAGESNLVDVYIRYLRLKIDKKYKKKLIHTVRGIGYKFEVDIQKKWTST
jgi:DNA-binding response OmpR family regulator